MQYHKTDPMQLILAVSRALLLDERSVLSLSELYISENSGAKRLADFRFFFFSARERCTAIPRSLFLSRVCVRVFTCVYLLYISIAKNSLWNIYLFIFTGRYTYPFIFFIFAFLDNACNASVKEQARSEQSMFVGNASGYWYL